ncbi:MAG TPA: T9SS type A sorting domain-containing protein [Candidatus Eisenbacteria bacterium]
MTKRLFAILVACLAGLYAAVAGAGDQAASDFIVFDGNMIWQCSQDGVNPLPWQTGSGTCNKSEPWLPAVPFTYSTTNFGTVYMTHNRTDVDPKLVDPFNLTNPRFDPQLGSPALSKYTGDAVVMNATALDPWFEQTDYIGAVPYRFADPSQDWTTGWTYYVRNGGLGRTDLPSGRTLVIVSGLQTTSQHWTSAHDYLLRGKVEFAGGTVLTIDPGVYIYGEKATVGYLTIDRGAQIMALGTKSAPIVLTSDQSPGSMAAGDDGGLVIHGRAVANCLASPSDSCVSEGGAGYYGGNDDNDNSGTIRYMRIEYSGQEISPDNELNSLTMNALGRGTSIEYVQTMEGFDDAFEWFGGTVHLKHIVGIAEGDDGLDWQLGFRGRVQFAVIQQEPGKGDKGNEADNSEFNFVAEPESNPIFSNITYIGAPTGGAGSTNIGVHWRRGTAGTLVNSIVLGFRGPGLQLSDPETYANCPGPMPAVYHAPIVTAVDTSPLNLGRIYMAASPNPLTSATKILFGLPRDQRSVRAQIFDARGRLVETLVNGPLTRGTHSVTWNTRGLPTGQYFFRVATEGGLSSSGKLVVVH